jgi:DNA-binding winged helix-turn-helix (wHTH) protein/TolB-like protein
MFATGRSTLSGVKFGVFEFDPAAGTLVREGTPVRLQAQPARVLAMLVGRAGDVVTRDELRQAIWGSETFVDFERGLNFCIAHIRSALGDSAASPRFIETVPRQGYRFIAPVSRDVETPVRLRPDTTNDTSADGAGASGFSRTRPRRTAAGVLAMAVVGVGLVAVLLWLRAPAAPAAVPLAVALFDNETGDASFDDVAKGMTDAIVVRLAAPELAGRLNVIGNAPILRTSRTLRDVQAIGSALGVQYVVLGQVKKDRERVRLIAHLIRVRDQGHVWAKTFDRQDVSLAIQSELADEIARSVVAKLVAG